MDKLTRRKLFLYASFFLLFFPGFTISLAPVLMPGTRKHYFYLFAPALLFFYRNKGFVLQCKREILFLFVAIFSFIYLGSGEYETAEDLYIPYLGLFFGMILLHLDDKWWEGFWNVIRIYCLVHLIAGLILRFMPDFQINHVVPLFSIDTHYRKLLIKLINQGYMTGLTHHYSTMGMYMASGVIAFAKPLLSGGRKVRWNDWFLFLAFAVGLIMTGKRGPVLFTAAALVITFWLTNKPFSAKQYRDTYILLLCGIAFFALLYFSVPQFRLLIARFSIDAGDVNGLSSNRVELYWLNAITFFLEKPYLGHGWRSFRRLNRLRFGVDFYNDAHNIYLQLLAETGIVGFALFMTLFVGSLVMANKAVSENKVFPVLSKKQVMSIQLAIAYQFYFLFYGLTGNPLYDAMAYAPYFMCCTIGYAGLYRVRQVHRWMKMREGRAV